MKQKIVLILAVIAGLIAAFLTGTYISAQKQALERERMAFERKNRSVDVVVLSKSLPAGTKLTMDDLGVLTFPERALREQTIRPEGNTALRLVGRTLAVGVSGRQPLLWSDIEGGAPGDGGLSSLLPPKMRAISI